MICYIFWKESHIINCKIDNISSILNGEIIGDSSCKFGTGSDYIVLQSDNINKNIGDVIDLTNLVDERDYFTKGKDQWYQNKIISLQQGHDELKQKGEELQCFSLDLQYQIDTK
jgi:hypothetical protein